MLNTLFTPHATLRTPCEVADLLFAWILSLATSSPDDTAPLQELLQFLQHKSFDYSYTSSLRSSHPRPVALSALIPSGSATIPPKHQIATDPFLPCAPVLPSHLTNLVSIAFECDDGSIQWLPTHYNITLCRTETKTPLPLPTTIYSDIRFFVDSKTSQPPHPLLLTLRYGHKSPTYSIRPETSPTPAYPSATASLKATFSYSIEHHTLPRLQYRSSITLQTHSGTSPFNLQYILLTDQPPSPCALRTLYDTSLAHFQTAFLQFSTLTSTTLNCGLLLQPAPSVSPEINHERSAWLVSTTPHTQIFILQWNSALPTVDFAAPSSGTTSTYSTEQLPQLAHRLSTIASDAQRQQLAC